MNGKLISLIYFYIVSLISLILLIIGIFQTVNFIVNMTQFSEYPLRFTQPCEFGPYPMKAAYVPGEPGASPSAEELKAQKEQCLATQKAERQKQKVDDLRNALTFTIIGAFLFGLHFPIALKRSKN